MAESVAEETFEIILIDPKTNEPYDENDPIILSKTDYDFIAAQAAAKGTSFEEEFIASVRLGIELLKNKG